MTQQNSHQDHVGSSGGTAESLGEAVAPRNYTRGDVVVAALTGETCRLRRRALGKGCEGVWESVVLSGHPATVGSIQYIKPVRLA